MLNPDLLLQTRPGYVMILLAAVTITILLNIVPFLAYPFRRLFTMIHEMGHVFATRLTGGEVIGFQVFLFDYDGPRGMALRTGGDPLVVIPAGYLSIAFFSAGLILLGNLPAGAPYILGAIGGLVILITLSYGWRALSTLLIGITTGALLVWVAWSVHVVWSLFLLDLLAIQGGITVLDDLWHLGQWVR